MFCSIPGYCPLAESAAQSLGMRCGDSMFVMLACLLLVSDPMIQAASRQENPSVYRQWTRSFSDSAIGETAPQAASDQKLVESGTLQHRTDPISEKGLSCDWLWNYLAAAREYLEARS